MLPPWDLPIRRSIHREVLRGTRPRKCYQGKGQTTIHQMFMHSLAFATRSALYHVHLFRSLTSTIRQILTEKAPFFELLNDITVGIKVIGGDRPSQPEPGVCDPILWILLQNCWHQDPNTRPSIHQITYRLVNPPIDAKVKESATDWDETSTSKFRRHFQDWSLLPSITEIERRIFGDGTSQG